MYNEVRNNIINNQMTYRKFSSCFNISIDDAIKIFQKLDLKRCSKGKNCINPNGPIQSRQNFYNNKINRDGLQGQCVHCERQGHQYYHQNNKEYFNQLNRQYYQRNKQEHNQRICQYYQNNKEYLEQRRIEYNNSYAKFNIGDQISYAEKTQRDPNNLELLQVKCAYCNSWFNPTNLQVRVRIAALEGRGSLGTENRFYCSDECKNSCPIYRQQDYSKDDPKYLNNLGTSREVQSELRQLVFERDNWTCQKCSTHKDNFSAGISLHCHHKEGIKHNPVESTDVDKCIAVCSECHKEIHRIPGCTYQDMQCKI